MDSLLEGSPIVDVALAVNLVRERMHDNGNDVGVSVASFFSDYPELTGIICRSPLTNENDIVDLDIIRTIVATPRVDMLLIEPSLEASNVLSILRKARCAFMNKEDLNMVGLAMHPDTTEQEAEALLFEIYMFCTCRFLYVSLGDFPEAMCIPFASFLGKSTSLSGFCLSWTKFPGDEPISIPKALLESILDGAAQSTSLNVINIRPHTANANSISEKLVHTVVNSASINTIEVSNSPLHAQLIQQALNRTTPLQTLDLCFRVSTRETDATTIIELDRNIIWKRALSGDIPLNYWATVLAKTNDWNRQTSHGPRDALFYLLREKNDVLIPSFTNHRHDDLQSETGNMF